MAAVGDVPSGWDTLMRNSSILELPVGSMQPGATYFLAFSARIVPVEAGVMGETNAHVLPDSLRLAASASVRITVRHPLWRVRHRCHPTYSSPPCPHRATHPCPCAVLCMRGSPLSAAAIGWSVTRSKSRSESIRLHQLMSMFRTVGYARPRRVLHQAAQQPSAYCRWAGADSPG